MLTPDYKGTREEESPKEEYFPGEHIEQLGVGFDDITRLMGSYQKKQYPAERVEVKEGYNGLTFKESSHTGPNVSVHQLVFDLEPKGTTTAPMPREVMAKTYHDLLDPSYAVESSALGLANNLLVWTTEGKPRRTFPEFYGELQTPDESSAVLFMDCPELVSNLSRLIDSDRQNGKRESLATRLKRTISMHGTLESMALLHTQGNDLEERLRALGVDLNSRKYSPNEEEYVRKCVSYAEDIWRVLNNRDDSLDPSVKEQINLSSKVLAPYLTGAMPEPKDSFSTVVHGDANPHQIFLGNLIDAGNIRIATCLLDPTFAFATTNELIEAGFISEITNWYMDSRNTLEEELGLPEHPFESIVTEEAYRKVGVYANLRLAGLEARQFLEGQGSDNAVEKISQYLENIQLLKKGILHTAPDEYNALDALVSAIENLKESNPGHHVRKLPREGSKLHLFRNRHRAGANKKTLAA